MNRELKIEITAVRSGSSGYDFSKLEVLCDEEQYELLKDMISDWHEKLTLKTA